MRILIRPWKMSGIKIALLDDWSIRVQRENTVERRDVTKNEEEVECLRTVNEGHGAHVEKQEGGTPTESKRPRPDDEVDYQLDLGGCGSLLLLLLLVAFTMGPRGLAACMAVARAAAAAHRAVIVERRESFKSHGVA